MGLLILVSGNGQAAEPAQLEVREQRLDRIIGIDRRRVVAVVALDPAAPIREFGAALADAIEGSGRVAELVNAESKQLGTRPTIT